MELMTRNEKINLLENLCTFLAANGYMDDDYRSEPPYAIDEFLKLTDEKISPPLSVATGGVLTGATPKKEDISEKERLKREFNLVTYGAVSDYDRKKIWDFFYSEIQHLRSTNS